MRRQGKRHPHADEDREDVLMMRRSARNIECDSFVMWFIII
jgi:hypothetical protein